MRTSSIVAGALFLLGAALPFTGAVAQDSGRNAPSAAASASDGGGDVGKRLQRVEEQIVDLSAQLGTVETMARASSAAPAAPSTGDAGGGDAGRIAQLETEVRALSSQVSELLQRLQALDGRSGGLAPAPQPGGSAQARSANTPQPDTGSRDVSRLAAQDAGASAPPSNSYGAANVEPSQPAPKPKKKSSGGLFGLFGGSSDETTDEPEPLTPSVPVQPRPQTSVSGSSAPAPDRNAGGAPVRQAQSASQPQTAPSAAQAKSLYDSAFMSLQEGNQKVAAEGFEGFIQRYPKDPMSGSAHFWLGEASFTNGEYRKAADNYLKTATDFPQSEKAPESLLKLGIALKRLNENDAACSTFSELARRFPEATSLLQRADGEKRRAKCP